MDERIRKYERMWTSEAHRYALIQLGDSYLVMDLATKGLLAMDDDDVVVAQVISRMRDAGVRILTSHEARTI